MYIELHLKGGGKEGRAGCKEKVRETSWKIIEKNSPQGSHKDLTQKSTEHE